ncbi:MAG: DUF192 domain-containing protein [Bacteroidetes bacterium]|nr:DUF192 domain-containing protein [Bacteroidota bacterium]
MMTHPSILPFPYANTTYIRFSNGTTKMALISCEAAITREEISQSLNHRSLLQFRKPMVLHFDQTSGQNTTCFQFRFDAEVIVVNPENIVEKVYPIRKYSPNEALHIHFFGGYAYAILAPKGFSAQWNIQAGTTIVKRISMHLPAEKTA